MYDGCMAKKKSESDVNVTAFRIMQIVTDSASVQKNPAAVALGRLGGLKGGPARKASLDAERRRQIASDAARTRWAKKGKS